MVSRNHVIVMHHEHVSLEYSLFTWKPLGSCLVIRLCQKRHELIGVSIRKIYPRGHERCILGCVFPVFPLLVKIFAVLAVEHHLKVLPPSHFCDPF